MRQLLNVWSRFNFVEGCDKAINAYVEKGFARKLSDEERLVDAEHWFLPDHYVISPHKPSPRVVFDSAAKHEGVCLKDLLETGPSLHNINDLPGMLLRFREKPIVLSGDVSDMLSCTTDIFGAIWRQTGRQTSMKYTESESKESERFHFFRLRLRLRRSRSAYDLVKTRLSESEAEAEDEPMTMPVPTLCDWFSFSASDQAGLRQSSFD